ncbi:MAG: TIGR00270 family protein [Thermoprotei archaeon]|nr:MAG: TIGR00270 family protein [Thermoprotei archaeon]
MKCEICGANIIGGGYKVYIDRAELIVCKKCAKKYGTPIETVQPSAPIQSRKQSLRRKIRYPRELRYTVVENYSEIIRKARIRHGYTRSLLASMVGEKESTIKRIEDGVLEPTLDLARRLEKILKVNLIEEDLEYPEWEDYRTRDYELTFGDIVVFKKGKEKHESSHSPA